jgi:type VI secretion system protein ImpB
MSNHKDGSIAPKERINIRYLPRVEGQTAEVELPLNLLITGDLKGQVDNTPLDERQPVSINKIDLNLQSPVSQSDIYFRLASE